MELRDLPKHSSGRPGPQVDGGDEHPAGREEAGVALHGLERMREVQHFVEDNGVWRLVGSVKSAVACWKAVRSSALAAARRTVG